MLVVTRLVACSRAHSLVLVELLDHSLARLHTRRALALTLVCVGGVRLGLVSLRLGWTRLGSRSSLSSCSRPASSSPPPLARASASIGVNRLSIQTSKQPVVSRHRRLSRVSTDIVMLVVIARRVLSTSSRLIVIVLDDDKCEQSVMSASSSQQSCSCYSIDDDEHRAASSSLTRRQSQRRRRQRRLSRLAKPLFA